MTESAYPEYERRGIEGRQSWNDEREYFESERTERFRDMQGLDTLLQSEITIAGVGAIGRQVAIGLVSMGVKNLTIVDPDTIMSHNMGPQGWYPKHNKKPKVEALASVLREINPQIDLDAVYKFYTTENDRGGHAYTPKHRPAVLFVCVDNMKSRNIISKTEALMPQHCIVDTRMGAFAYRVICDEAPFERWKKTLFSDSASFAGKCTLQSTYFAAQVCAGNAIAAYATWASANPGGRFEERGKTPGHFVPVDFIGDLLDFDLTHQTGDEPPIKDQLKGNADLASSELSEGWAAPAAMHTHGHRLEEV